MYTESLPLNADALVLMALGCYHHVSLIQDKHFDFLGIYEFQFGTPVQHSAGCANYNLLGDLLTSLHCRDKKEGFHKMAAQTVKCSAPLWTSLFHHLTALLFIYCIAPDNHFLIYTLLVAFHLTHIYCLGQHMQVSALDKTFPSVQSLFLFEVPARMLGKGTNTGGTEG